MNDNFALELIGITKSFPGVMALKDVTLRVRAGEVHALVGENGAGKSTLLKIMFGILPQDAGKILLQGKEVFLSSPSHAQRLGISLVHQELQQIPELNVAQNIFLAREFTYPGGLLINRKKSYVEAENLLQRIGMQINVRVPIKTLSIAERQMVEIAKALQGQARVIAFDEPTSSLTNVETDKLFQVIRDLRAQGVGIIYVSHRLEEIMRIADTVTVLRDGQFVGEAPIEAVDQAAIVRMMIGKKDLGERVEGALMEAPTPSRSYRLGAVVKYLGNPYWKTLARGMEEEAANFGLSLDIRSGENEADPLGQLAQTEELVDSGIDALLISPQTDANLAPAVERARSRGIALVNVNDAVLPDAEHYVGPNQYDSGVRAANYFVRMLPEGGKVAIIEGQKDVFATQQRTRGFKDTLPANRFTIVASVSGEWDKELSRRRVGKILAEHPDLVGVYCNNDIMALGAMEAVKAAGKLGEIVVIGNDGISDAYTSIQAGEITGTVDSFPEQTGRVAVRAAISLLEGQKVPREVFTAQNLITLHNIHHPNNPPYPEVQPGEKEPRPETEATEKTTDITAGALEEEVLRVVNLHNPKLKNASFYLKRGELLGIAGLVGSGRTEMMRALFGADPAAGEVYIRGKKVHIRSPEDAIRHGLGFLPEDRKGYGLLRLLSVKVNISLASLPHMQWLGFLDASRIARESMHFVETLKIQPPYLERLALNLSGGNQQKVILARWLLANSEILIFDEPTRGIDVGAKSEIYRLMEDLTHQGKSIIMVSSELPEILRMSHRILVMREGEIVKELPRSEASQESIMYYATGGK